MQQFEQFAFTENRGHVVYIIINMHGSSLKPITKIRNYEIAMLEKLQH